MNDEHINILRTLKGMSPLRYGPALDAAIAALGGVGEPIGEMRENGVNWFGPNPHAFPVGTAFYALPAPPSKEG